MYLFNFNRGSYLVKKYHEKKGIRGRNLKWLQGAFCPLIHSVKLDQKERVILVVFCLLGEDYYRLHRLIPMDILSTKGFEKVCDHLQQIAQIQIKFLLKNQELLFENATFKDFYSGFYAYRIPLN